MKKLILTLSIITSLVSCQKQEEPIPQATADDLSGNYYNSVLPSYEKAIISDSVYRVSNVGVIDTLNVWSRENFFNQHVIEISLTGDTIVVNSGILFIKNMQSW